jgi:hypothetical protein
MQVQLWPDVAFCGPATKPWCRRLRQTVYFAQLLGWIAAVAPDDVKDTSIWIQLVRVASGRDKCWKYTCNVILFAYRLIVSSGVGQISVSVCTNHSTHGDNSWWQLTLCVWRATKLVTDMILFDELPTLHGMLYILIGSKRWSTPNIDGIVTMTDSRCQ